MKKTLEKTKLISVRYSTQQYLQIESTAEEQQIEKVELLRKTWDEKYNMNSMKDQIFELELKLKKDMFQIICVVAGLDSVQKKEALNALNKVGVTF